MLCRFQKVIIKESVTSLILNQNPIKIIIFLIPSDRALIRLFLYVILYIGESGLHGPEIYLTLREKCLFFEASSATYLTL